MNIVDMDDRWAYQGSQTVPPCYQGVYWNIARSVYPIGKEHLEQIDKLMSQIPGLKQSGNNRIK